MTLRWTLGHAAEGIGTLYGSNVVKVNRVATDSRSVRPDDIFVAIRGEKFDGHHFASAALEGGAAAVVTEPGYDHLRPRIEVPDTSQALLGLAAKRRSELTMPVIGVTGSTGKTTTKDLLGAAITGSWVSQGSYNNEVGVPLTVLSAPADASALVAEMGSRGKGHLEWLVPAVRPNVAVITNLGLAHLHTFGGTAALTEAKWELVAGLGAGGVAVLPVDEPRLHRDHAGTTITFGQEQTADVFATDIEMEADGCCSFMLVCSVGQRRVRLTMPGLHQPVNAAAAAAAALAVGVDLDRLVDGLSTAQTSRWRMEITAGRFTVVNDAYNANPTSVNSALRTVAQLPGRAVAVLGEMAELGSVSHHEHVKIGELAANLGYSVVVVVGDDPGIADGAGSIARKVETPDQAVILLGDYLSDGDVVLVKASRSVGLEGLARQLAAVASHEPADSAQRQ